MGHESAASNAKHQHQPLDCVGNTKAKVIPTAPWRCEGFRPSHTGLDPIPFELVEQPNRLLAFCFLFLL